MRTRTDRRTHVGVAVIGVALAQLAIAAEPAATLANLQAAFAADVQAQAEYRELAGRAEREGRRHDAALFRAAAHAEGVRARMHAEVARQLGSEPHPAPLGLPPATRDTAASLRSVLARESAERVGVYPRYVDQARRDAVPAAILAFTLSHHAEAALVEIYRDAVAGRLRGDPAVDFHVCETCGFVIHGDPPERCPVSLTGRAAFTRIR
jgi:rubrerythrin